MSFTKDFKDANNDFSAFRNEILSHIGGGKLIDIERAGQSKAVETQETNLAALCVSAFSLPLDKIISLCACCCPSP